MGHIYFCNHNRNNYKIKQVVATESNLKDLSTAKCNFDLDLTDQNCVCQNSYEEGSPPSVYELSGLSSLLLKKRFHERYAYSSERRKYM